MSRLVHRSIEVTTNEDTPEYFIDGGTKHVVSHVIDSWMESGAWWEGELHRTIYRVQTVESFLFDLQVTGGHWSIYRVWD